MNLRSQLNRGWKLVLRVLLVCSGFALALAVPASADTFVYTYQGNSFTTFGSAYTCSGTCAIQGSFTVASQLDAGLSNASVTPTLFSFTDGNGFTLSGPPLPLHLGDVIIVAGINTDGIGDITAWNINVIGCLGHCAINTESTGSGGTAEDQSIPFGLIVPPATEPADEAFNIGMPGTWTCQEQEATGALIPCPAAPSAPTPEPSSLYLLGSGLFGLVGMGLRKSKWRSENSSAQAPATD